MSPFLALMVVVAVVAAATALGVLGRHRAGRVRDGGSTAVTPAEVGESGGFGDRATLLQFSTEFCAPCRATRPVLARLARSRNGVTHVEVDLTRRPELADRFNILQTPTTLILDQAGRVRGRIGGAPRLEDLTTCLDEILEGRNARIA